MSLDELDRLAAFLENPEDLLPDIAADAGPEIQRVARAEYAQGIGPAGQHAPRKKDGALALQRHSRRSLSRALVQRSQAVQKTFFGITRDQSSLLRIQSERLFQATAIRFRVPGKTRSKMLPKKFLRRHLED